MEIQVLSVVAPENFESILELEKVWIGIRVNMVKDVHYRREGLK